MSFNKKSDKEHQDTVKNGIIAGLLGAVCALYVLYIQTFQPSKAIESKRSLQQSSHCIYPS